jgi:hypothetical protein
LLFANHQEQEETLLDYEDADEAQEAGAGGGASGAAKKCVDGGGAQGRGSFL